MQTFSLFLYPTFFLPVCLVVFLYVSNARASTHFLARSHSRIQSFYVNSKSPQKKQNTNIYDSLWHSYTSNVLFYFIKRVVFVLYRILSLQFSIHPSFCPFAWLSVFTSVSFKLSSYGEFFLFIRVKCSGFNAFSSTVPQPDIEFLCQQ